MKICINGKGKVRKTVVFVLCTLFTLAFGLSILFEIAMSEYDCYTKEPDPVYFSVMQDFFEYKGIDNPFLAEQALPGGYFHFIWVLVLALFELKYWMYLITVVTFIFATITFVSLMRLSGRHPKEEGVFPGVLNRVPTDVVWLLGAIVIAIPWGVWDAELSYGMSGYVNVLAGVSLSLLSWIIFLGLCMDLAARIKEHSVLKNTVIWRIAKLIGKGLKWCGKYLKIFFAKLVELFRSLPMIWRTVVGLSAFIILDAMVLILSRGETDNYAIFFVIKTMFIVPVVLFGAITLRKLQAQGEELAAGNLSAHVDTNGLFWDFKKHAENLNNIAKGMTIAVNDRLKSEHMKTELITNVSHDIKTPLTSIVNYANLIANEPTDNENIKEYTEVLLRQSGRLKHLIEDLVEASKASTGNLEVNLEPCEASVFVTQIAGEYEEKLQKAGLTAICRVPEEDITIMADGRRMLRVFDNLLNNICKYSLEGSRVYLSLVKTDNKAVFSFKNTSKAELNISEEELMERFTRGDSSRNTEGNGLGISIAKSITELQNGKFTLTVDGDLFKVELEFPVVE